MFIVNTHRHNFKQTRTLWNTHAFPHMHKLSTHSISAVDCSKSIYNPILLPSFNCMFSVCNISEDGKLVQFQQVYWRKTIHVCPVCEESFPPGHIMRHRREAHPGYRRVLTETICEFCGGKLSNRYIAERHRALHLKKERRKEAVPFLCSVCGMSFRVKERLIEHQANHTGEKRYVRCSFLIISAFSWAL